MIVLITLLNWTFMIFLLREIHINNAERDKVKGFMTKLIGIITQEIPIHTYDLTDFINANPSFDQDAPDILDRTEAP